LVLYLMTVIDEVYVALIVDKGLLCRLRHCATRSWVLFLMGLLIFHDLILLVALWP
jgi:hypothetical protein